MHFDPTFTVSNALTLLSLLIACASAVYAWIGTRRSNVDERFRTGKERMDRHEQRLTRLEHDLADVPSKDDLHHIQLSMSEINGTMKQMAAVMEGNQKIMTRLETVVFRHEDHLLNK
ncbi:DUF2730 family protein [Phaeobacter sp. B1627]|uniref:DUF2730 family protein n=1 Tax=Phaeobacter sp. B1627 TaxID=2583809 RepID=UPI00111872BC|nr:DUF2730 family protein [Phaeobacter sp. B1627]TNJ40481.1 DUF2730 family protein [Phaeobacter sp. B1627]